MKKIALTLVCVVAVVGIAASSFAQGAGPRGGGQGGAQGGQQRGPGGPGGGMRGRMDEAVLKRILTQIKATPAEVKKVEAVMKKRADDSRALMTKVNGGKAPQQGQRPNWSEAQMKQLRDGMDKIRKDSEAGMKSALGSKYPAFEKAVRAEMEKMRAQRQSGGGAQGGGRASGGGAQGGGKASGGARSTGGRTGG